jgi:UDP-N-acetylglucosamine acyltransferase
MTCESATVHPTAVIGPNVDIGEGAYIGPLCVLGAFAEHPTQYTKPKGRVVIGEGAVLTKLVTVDSPTDAITIVGRDSYLMAHSHVGHDAVLGEGSILACGAKVGGWSSLGNFCNIGLNAVLHQKSVLADGVMVAASAFFKGNAFKMFSIYAGVPAKYIKDNSVLIERLKHEGVLDDALVFTGKRRTRSPQAGD